MKFIRDLLGKKRHGKDIDRSKPVEQLEQSYRDTIGSMVDEANALSALPSEKDPEPTNSAPKTRIILADPTPEPAAKAAVNIWDLEDDGPSTELPAPSSELPAAPAQTPEVAPAPTPARSPARSRRTKTRLIGFEKSDGDVVDLFNDQPAAAPTKSVKFPVGWIIVIDGPGRGECFTLQTGMSQIGRGEDQAVQLDFGDNSISRSNHAAIVYDPDNKEFLLGHGGKSNIVRLNDKPVISNESIKTGDTIRIGETVLRFVALCDKSFNWSDGGTEEDEDVAIA